MSDNRGDRRSAPGRPEITQRGVLGAATSEDRIPQRAEPVPASSGATVTVACKMPNGLLLRNFRMEKYYEPVMGGGVRETERAVPLPGTVVVNGFAIDFDKLRANQGLDKAIVGGYALTPGVPKDFWDAWLEANRDSDIVRNHIIFAYEREDHARGAAREKAKISSGLEPIDRDNPGGRMPQSRFGARIEPGTRF